jgi:hypothetical protein
LRDLRDQVETFRFDVHGQELQPAPDDVLEFRRRHAWHVDVHERPIDRTMFRQKLVEAVRDPDDDERRRDRLIRQRLDRVGEETCDVRISHRVELVDQDDALSLDRNLLQHPTDIVRRQHVLGHQFLDRATRGTLLRQQHVEFVHGFLPHGREVVGGIAVHPYGELVCVTLEDQPQDPGQ